MKLNYKDLGFPDPYQMTPDQIYSYLGTPETFWEPPTPWNPTGESSVPPKSMRENPLNAYKAAQGFTEATDFGAGPTGLGAITPVGAFDINAPLFNNILRGQQTRRNAQAFNGGNVPVNVGYGHIQSELLNMFHPDYRAGAPKRQDFQSGRYGLSGLTAPNKEYNTAHGDYMKSLTITPEMLQSMSVEQLQKLIHDGAQKTWESKQNDGPLSFLTNPKFAIPAILSAGVGLGLGGFGGLTGGATSAGASTAGGAGALQSITAASGLTGGGAGLAAGAAGAGAAGAGGLGFAGNPFSTIPGGSTGFNAASAAFGNSLPSFAGAGGAAAGAAGAGIGAGTGLSSMGSAFANSLPYFSGAGVGGTAAGGGLLSSLSGLLGGGDMSSVLSSVIGKLPGMVDMFTSGSQAEDNAKFLKGLLGKISPEELLKTFEGSQSFDLYKSILENPQQLAIFNAILSQSTNQANASAARGGFLPPGDGGSLTGGYADLLSKLMFANAGEYQTGILNSLPLSQTSNLISNSLNPTLNVAGGILSARNQQAELNPWRAMFGGQGNSLLDSIASLF